MQTEQGHVNGQPTSSAPTFTPSVPSSYVPPSHGLIIDPHAVKSPSGSSIPTPPPSANPQSLSHQHSIFPTHGIERVSPGDSWIYHAHQPAMRLQNLQHVSPNYLQQQQQQQQQHGQQQQVLHAENGVVHAQLAPPPPPPQNMEPQAPRLRPSTFPQQQQQQQQTMTHPTMTSLVPATAQVRSSPDQYHRRTPSSVQVTDAARLHGPQPAQPPMPGQAPPRGLQAQSAALATPGAPGMQTRPQRATQPYAHMSERPQTMPATSPASTQAQSQAQQQLQQDRLAAAPAIAAFKVLQPAKALFEKTWSTAIASVQQEFVAVHSEHIRAANEQHRLTELLRRSEVERTRAGILLQEANTELAKCRASLQREQRARSHLEQKLADMLAQCVCGGALSAVKKPATTPLPSLPPPRPSSSTSSPSRCSAVLAAPSLEKADGEACATSAHSVAPTMALSSPAEKPRDLRREREEEAVDDETASKRRKLTPNFVMSSLPIPATPAPVLEILSTPEITKAQKVAEAIVPYARNLALYPQHAPQSAPAPESEQEQSENPPAATADAASAPRKIGIQHIQLVYEVVGETLQCRMCLLRKREVDEGTEVATYPIDAAYHTLVGHCEREHEAALDALASMTPSEIAEMHQRMQAAR